MKVTREEMKLKNNKFQNSCNIKTIAYSGSFKIYMHNIVCSAKHKRNKKTIKQKSKTPSK